MYLLKVNGRPTGLSATALSRANFLQSSPDCIKQHDNERRGEEFKVYQFAAHCNFSLYTVRRKSTCIIMKSPRYGTSFRGLMFLFMCLPLYLIQHFSPSVTVNSADLEVKALHRAPREHTPRLQNEYGLKDASGML